MHDGNASTVGPKSVDKEALGAETSVKDAAISIEKKSASSPLSSCFLLVCFPCAYICSCTKSNEESSDQQTSEDGMFYCSLCEVEVCRGILTKNLCSFKAIVVAFHYVICRGGEEIIFNPTCRTEICHCDSLI